ncbi:hypothetical protein V6N13_063540 [Hibiscus sabdariffa]|uniref:Uncharacterized protein n=2 Tax=Hibiscus sabdariffa TaxID=183260 RepID=A0ABR2G4V0_9ROSI
MIRRAEGSTQILRHFANYINCPKKEYGLALAVPKMQGIETSRRPPPLIKLASVKLAMKYMRRVSLELEAVGFGSEEEESIVEGVRFAFHVQQFANGFGRQSQIMQSP